MLTASNVTNTFDRLDQMLLERHFSRRIIVCGGTALLLLGIGSRATRDVDVIDPKIDSVLKDLSVQLSEEFILPKDWLNNGPSSLKLDLLKGWENRIEMLFQGKALTVNVLGRLDLLATKLYAFCDREDDYIDVLNMAPTPIELDELLAWVLARDASELWPDRVNRCFDRLRKALHNA